MADQKEKSPIKWIYWTAILLILAGIILVIQTENPSTKKSSEPRQLSGTFTVPAGKGPWESKTAYVERSEFFWIASSSKIKILDCASGQTVQITSRGWMSQRPATKAGHLNFMRENEPVEINFKIIN